MATPEPPFSASLSAPAAQPPLAGDLVELREMPLLALDGGAVAAMRVEQVAHEAMVRGRTVYQLGRGHAGDRTGEGARGGLLS